MNCRSGGGCPVSGCGLPAHPKDYKENRTLGQIARCLENIKDLLENKENVTEGKVMSSNEVDSCKAGNRRTPLESSYENKHLDTDQTEPLKVSKPTNIPDQFKTSESRTSDSERLASSQLTTDEGENPIVRSTKSTRTPFITKRDKGNGSRIKSKPFDKNTVSNNSDTPNQRSNSRLSLPSVKKASKVNTKSNASRKSDPTDSSMTASNSSKVGSAGNIEKKNKKGETQLHSACGKGSLEIVKSLLQQGANPNTQDFAGWTPLHETAASGRVDIASLLLEYGARPSVPSKEERVTALHDAVGSAQIDMVRLLVSKGADVDAKDNKGNTPRSLASKIGKDMVNAIENTKVEISPSNMKSASFSPKDMLLCLTKKVASNQSNMKVITQVTMQIGCKKPSASLCDDTTHLMMEEDEDEISYQFLSAVVLGVDIVKYEWFLECSRQEAIVKSTPFNYVGKAERGIEASKIRRDNNQPGLFAGIHFYLQGLFDPPCMSKSEIQNIIKSAGGKLLSREPDPEFIPSQESTVPHYAESSSDFATTSHVILYVEGSKREPMIKYNMQHVKTLPITWLVKSIFEGSLVPL